MHILYKIRTFEKKNCPQANLECFKHVKEFLKHHQFVSNFDHKNFPNNGAYSTQKIDNPNYCAPFMIF